MATSSNGIQGIEKLKEDNYESWNQVMKSVLVWNELWKYANGTEIRPAENAATWVEKDEKALALITMGLTYKEGKYIKSCMGHIKGNTCIERTGEESHFV